MRRVVHELDAIAATHLRVVKRLVRELQRAPRPSLWARVNYGNAHADGDGRSALRPFMLDRELAHRAAHPLRENFGLAAVDVVQD